LGAHLGAQMSNLKWVECSNEQADEQADEQTQNSIDTISYNTVISDCSLLTPPL